MEKWEYSEQDIKDNTYCVALMVCQLLAKECLSAGQEADVFEAAKRILETREVTDARQ